MSIGPSRKQVLNLVAPAIGTLVGLAVRVAAGTLGRLLIEIAR